MQGVCYGFVFAAPCSFGVFASLSLCFAQFASLTQLRTSESFAPPLRTPPQIFAFTSRLACVFGNGAMTLQTEKRSVGKLGFSDTIDIGETVLYIVRAGEAICSLSIVLYHKKEKKATVFLSLFLLYWGDGLMLVLTFFFSF